MPIKLFNTTIGLALGGGAAKGVAHVGVLKALEDANVDIEYIAGTSVGAMLAALYAFNVNIETIGELSRRLTLSKVTTFKLNKTGFFSTHSLKELMLEYLGDVNIEDAKIPLAIVATDINSGEEVILTSRRWFGAKRTYRSRQSHGGRGDDCQPSQQREPLFRTKPCS